MYSDRQFLLHFLLILTPTTWYKSLPFKWNSRLKQMENAFTSPTQQKIYQLKCNFHVACTLGIVIQVILHNAQNPITKAMCTFTVAMLSLTTVVVKEYSRKESDAVSLIFRLIQSSKHLDGKKSKSIF